MPVKVVKNLPAIEQLRADNIFVMDSERAEQQNIRPLNLLIVNLMPRKMVTETQILRLLSNTPLQINVDLLYPSSHVVKNTQQSYLDNFYHSFSEVRAKYYDGLIITGAPLEQMAFEAVDYWLEFLEIIEWSKRHVYSTLHICWGAQAGLYARYGITKQQLPQKVCGVFKSTVENHRHPLFRGFDDYFSFPHSRYTACAEEQIRILDDFEVLSHSQHAGLGIVAKKNLREIYLFGHLEYDRETLEWEYQRDKAAGLSAVRPQNYFPEDDEQQPPVKTWASAASLFFSNWLNYAVYQATPYVGERLSSHYEEDYDFNQAE